MQAQCCIQLTASLLHFTQMRIRLRRSRRLLMHSLLLRSFMVTSTVYLPVCGISLNANIVGLFIVEIQMTAAAIETKC